LNKLNIFSETLQKKLYKTLQSSTKLVKLYITQVHNTLHICTKLYNTLHNSTKIYITIQFCFKTHTYKLLQIFTNTFFYKHFANTFFKTNKSLQYSTQILQNFIYIFTQPFKHCTNLLHNFYNTLQIFTALYNTCTHLYNTFPNFSKLYKIFIILFKTLQHVLTKLYATLHNSTALYDIVQNTTLQQLTNLYTTFTNFQNNFTTRYIVQKPSTLFKTCTQLYTTLHNIYKTFQIIYNFFAYKLCKTFTTL